MKRISLTLALTLLVCISYATIIHVPADYSTIQSGIINANEGDTVLVQNGTYTETINMGSQSIVLASMFIFTQDSSDIINTVIDGNGENSVISNFLFGLLKYEIVGFTIINGGSDEGGGIYHNSMLGGDTVILRNLVIRNCYANDFGGGIYLGTWDTASYIKIANVDLIFNGANNGGGIFAEGMELEIENVTIDSTASESMGGGIYLNECDVRFNNVVFNRNESWGMYGGGSGGAIYTKRSELSFQNTYFYRNWPDAICIDSSFQELSNMHFSEDIVSISIYNSEVILHDITIESSGSAAIQCMDSYLTIYDVLFDGHNDNAIEMIDSDGLIRDVIIKNGSGGIYCSNSSPVIRNIEILNNHIEPATPWDNLCGLIECVNNSNSLIINTIITSNNSIGNIQCAGVLCEESNPVLINVTIADNDFDNNGAGIMAYTDAHPDLYNSIIWNNSTYNIRLGSPTMHSQPSINISHSNIEGGEQAIHAPFGTVYWDEGNIVTDPLFLNSGDYPFELSDLSPCIDAGNPDTAGLNLPMYDFIGNYRLCDGNEDGDTIIDMGACEYGSIGVGTYYYAETQKNDQLLIYPNPTESMITIRYRVQGTGCRVQGIVNCQLSIFDVNGRLIDKMQIDKEIYSLDVSHLMQGIYFITVRSESGIVRGKFVKR